MGGGFAQKTTKSLCVKNPPMTLLHFYGVTKTPGTLGNPFPPSPQRGTQPRSAKAPPAPLSPAATKWRRSKTRASAHAGTQVPRHLQGSLYRCVFIEVTLFTLCLWETNRNTNILFGSFAIHTLLFRACSAFPDFPLNISQNLTPLPVRYSRVSTHCHQICFIHCRLVARRCKSKFGSDRYICSTEANVET